MTTPALGYPTRTDAVVALQHEGKRPREIAILLGIPVKSVSALACSARRRARPLPGAPSIDAISTASRPRHEVPSQSVSVSALLPIDVRQTLARQARKRDVSLDRLIFDLLSAIAEDNLVNAVLDDRGAA